MAKMAQPSLAASEVRVQAHVRTRSRRGSAHRVLVALLAVSLWTTLGRPGGGWEVVYADRLQFKWFEPVR